MNSPCTGLWLDGQTLAARAVTLETAAGALRVCGLETERLYPLAAVRCSNRLGTVPRFLYLPDGAIVETSDHQAVDALLLAPTGRVRGAAMVHWLEQRAGVAVAATVILVVTVALAVAFGLPWLARRGAEAVPAGIEQQVGRAALQTLARWLKPSQLTPRERRRVATQLDRLTRVRPPPASPTLVYYSMSPHPNALALPGGYLVVSDELVRLATDDELAAVLAHELGHWQHRHGLQGLLRSSAALLLMTGVTGDLSTLTTFAGTLPFIILQRGYSREFEAEADAYAVETLRLAGIGLDNFSSILLRLEEARPATGPETSYLSTHPATAERIRKLGLPPPVAASVPPGGTTLTNPALRTAPAPGLDRSLQLHDQGLYRPELYESFPKPLQQTGPVYPGHLRAQNIEGSVTVEFIVAEDGSVQSACVVQSTHPDFEPAALEAISQWTFSPGRAHGRAVKCRIQQPFTFNLQGPETSASPAPDAPPAPPPPPVQ